MNAKKSLENRIRGWFPKEPNPPKHVKQYTQPTTTNQKIKSMNIQKSITNVGVINLIFSIGLGGFSLFVLGLSRQGWLFNGHAFGLYDKVIVASWTGFAAPGFVLSAMLLIGFSSKRLWYALMSFWVLLLVFWLGIDFTAYFGSLSSIFQRISESSSVLIFGPIVYSACCIVYFLTKGPKQYFHFSA